MSTKLVFCSWFLSPDRDEMEVILEPSVILKHLTLKKGLDKVKMTIDAVPLWTHVTRCWNLDWLTSLTDHMNINVKEQLRLLEQRVRSILERGNYRKCGSRGRKYFVAIQAPVFDWYNCRLPSTSPFLFLYVVVNMIVGINSATFSSNFVWHFHCS